MIKKYFKQVFQNAGDIDLYLLLKEHSNLFEKKIKFLSRVKRELGEQKIDYKLKSDLKEILDAIERLAKEAK